MPVATSMRVCVCVCVCVCARQIVPSSISFQWNLSDTVFGLNSSSARTINPSLLKMQSTEEQRHGNLLVINKMQE